MGWFNRARARIALWVAPSPPTPLPGGEGSRLGISAEVRDGDRGWTSLSGGGPVDRSLAELQDQLQDVVEAWRLNAWVRQVVRLTKSYVVGDGLTVSSKIPEVQEFISTFWSHPENRMSRRLRVWCDELTRAGEIYPVLFTNKVDGMSQVRAVPASCIIDILTDPEDYEKELSYKEQVNRRDGSWSLEPRVWKSWRTAKVFGWRDDGRTRRPDPVMLHYRINELLGATRGESDLTPLLPWANRYTSWLKERALFNRIRNALMGLVIRISDPSKVKEKQEQYKNLALEGGVLVIGPDEEVTAPSLNLGGGDASPDGKALRLAGATAANLSLIHFGEGDTAPKSTAASMDDRTYRFYRERREDLAEIVEDLIFQAYRRQQQVLGLEVPVSAEELQISVEYPDISRVDNKDLATAMREMVTALGDLKHDFDLGPAFDTIAIRLAFKFAGEILGEDEIKELLAGRGVSPPDPPEGGEQSRQGGLNGSGNSQMLDAITTHPFTG